MNSQRHILRRYESDRSQDFDEQFWPVALALCVLAALTTGTILTLLRGPWMWASLLALPILVGLGLLGLSYVEHRIWRRSIQVALLLSFAFHLFVLIVAFRTEVFGGRPQNQIAQFQRPTPIPQLEISVTQADEIWNQPNEIATPDTEVTDEREQNSTMTQPTAARAEVVDAAQANPNPKLERRELTSETTPQVGESLSKKSRRLDAPSRQSRELTVAAVSAPPSKAATAEPTENSAPDQVVLERNSAAESESVLRRQADPASSEQARTRNTQRREERPSEPAVAAARQPRRTAQVQPQPSTSPVQPVRASTADANIENSRSDVPAADVAATRRDPSPSLTRSTENKSEPRPRDRQLERSETTQIADAMATPTANARNQRQRQTRAPVETEMVEDRSQANELVESQIQPSPESAQIARQQTPDRTISSNGLPSVQLEQTPSSQPAREIVRRAQPVERPSDVPTTGAQPRSARDAAPAPTTTQSIESPAVANASTQSSTAALEAQTLALNRSTIGTSGSGATPNFGRAAESAASPAQIASDSARREQPTSSSNTAAALSPSQASKISRSASGLEVSHASLPTTAETADRAAGSDPQPINASAAAALTSASAAGRRSEISADVGAAELDIGSTKIVSGAARRESAGGGQPELSAQSPSATRVGQQRGAAQATIVADVVAESTAANVTEGSARPAAINAEPTATATVAQRSGASHSRATGPSRGEFTGEPSDISSAAIANKKSAAHRAQRADRGTEGDQTEDDDQSATVRRAAVMRRSPVDGPAADGQPGGLARQSTAERTANEPESAHSDVSRSNYSDSVSAVSPAQSQSDDGFAGTSKTTSNSMQRRSEDSPQTDGEPQSMASSPDRTGQSLQLEIASGMDGAEFDRGMKADVAASEAEPTARALDAQRASGKGESSIGPSSRKEESLAATSAAIVDGTGRARATAAVADEVGENMSASKPRRGTSSSLNDDASVELVTSENPGIGVESNSNSDSDQVTSAKRTERSEARVDIDWEDGAGGLGQNVHPDIGVASRRASPTSTVVALEPSSRFRRRDTSGDLSASAAAVVAEKAFRGRNPGSLGRSGPQTEQAIESGLAFLIRNQQSDGHWSLLGFDEGQSLQQHQLDSDTAATGLTLLAFQGAGYTHREFKYAERLNRAVEWLVSHQSPDGNLYVESDKLSNESCQLYSHAIATLALTEAYGMTQDPALREAAQKAIDFIVETQDPKRGGWRYYSETERRMTDTSVTGWMVTALHSGRLSGLKVNGKVWTGVDQWLETAQAADSESQFRYDPNALLTANNDRDASEGRKPSKCMTAVGLLMRMYTGWDRNDPRLLEGASDLLKQLPTEFNAELRDTYYWYYATQVLRHIDGPQWQKWNQALHPLLLSTQIPDGELAGSWNPFTPVEDKWGRFGGRLYLTTLNLLSLEVDYRLLPLYEKTVGSRTE